MSCLSLQRVIIERMVKSMPKYKNVYEHYESSFKSRHERIRVINSHHDLLRELKKKRRFKAYDIITKAIRKFGKSYYLVKQPTDDQRTVILVIDKDFRTIGEIIITPSNVFNSNLFDDKHYTVGIDINKEKEDTFKQLFLKRWLKLADKYQISSHVWLESPSEELALCEAFGFQDTGYKANAGQIQLYTYR